MEVSDAISNATVKIRAKLDPAVKSLNSVNAALQIHPIISSFFDIDFPDSTTSSQVKEITEYLRSHGADTDEKMVDILKDINLRVGSDNNISKIDRFHKYVRLRNQARQLDLAATAMEK